MELNSVERRRHHYDHRQIAAARLRRDAVKPKPASGIALKDGAERETTRFAPFL
jgi:hypothetical protein